MSDTGKIKALVTGGSGFVGSLVCRKLTALGCQTTDISLKNRMIDDVHSIEGSITDKRFLETQFEDHHFDVIIHLAAMLVSASERNPAAATRVNVEGSLHLLELARSHHVRRFVYGSSLNVIGPKQDSDSPYDEDSIVSPTGFYGLTKHYVEQMGKRLGKVSDYKFVAARIPLVLGPGIPSTSSSFRMDMFNFLKTGGIVEMPFAPDQVLPIAHVDDVAEAIVTLALAQRLSHSIYHLPFENWKVETLCDEVQRVSPGIQFQYGERRYGSSPHTISWERIRMDTHIQEPDMKSRLRACL